MLEKEAAGTASPAMEMPPSEPPSPYDSDSNNNNHTKEAIQPESTPEIDESYLDSWRGWVVVAAASLSLFVYMGVIYCWGIIQAELVRTSTGNMTLTSLTFVGALATSCMCSLSVPVGMVIRKFGYRKTAVAGALFLGLGEFASSWATESLPALFITHGVLFGIGGGLTILPCSTAPLKWFKARRGLATGVVFGGASLGAAVIGVASHQLVDSVGVPWTFRILAFLLWAVCLPAACLIKQPPGAKATLPALQWFRFKEPRFIVLLIASSVGCFPLFVPPYFIPIFARSISSSGSVAIVALTVWNLASTVGRVGAGWVADTRLGALNTFMISMFLCGISALAIWPFASTVGLLIFFAVVNGIGCGSFFSLFTTVLGSVFGPENTMGILPMVWTGWFLGFFFGTPIASKVYTSAGADAPVIAYRPAAYYAGAMSFGGMVIMCALRLRRVKQTTAAV